MTVKREVSQIEIKSGPDMFKIESSVNAFPIKNKNIHKLTFEDIEA